MKWMSVLRMRLIEGVKRCERVYVRQTSEGSKHKRFSCGNQISPIVWFTGSL